MMCFRTTAWYAAVLVGISGSPVSADTVLTPADVAHGTDHIALFSNTLTVCPNGPTSVLVTLTTAPMEFELVGGPRFDATATFTFTSSTAVVGTTYTPFSTTGMDPCEGAVPAGILDRLRGGPTSDILPMTLTDPKPQLSPASTPPAAVLGLIGVLGLLGWRMWTRRRNSVAPA
jgi:MYXO-CTERM domain-containing protein